MATPADDAATLPNQELFDRYPKCPICGSPDRSELPTPSRTNHYLAAGARYLGISESDLIDAMKGKRCGACGGVYFDPWLSTSVSRTLYETTSFQHNLGWQSLWSYVRDPEPRRRDADLHKSLRNAVPSLDTYAEIGCPFAGLIPYLSMREYQLGSRRFSDYPGRFSLARKVGEHPKARGGLNLERLGAVAARFFNSLQLLRVFPARRLAKRGLRRLARMTESRPHTTACSFIRLESSLLWGRNCRSLGTDCSAALHNVFGATLLDLADMETEGLRFDVIGIFNALDHYKNPIGLLNRLFEHTDYVYIEGHYAGEDWGKQHLFFFEPETIRALPSLLRDVVVDPGFRYDPRPHWYSMLLKRRSRT